MPRLAVTLIDVGWGDSLLLESETAAGGLHYALIDSNDTTTLRSSYIFLRRHFEKKGVQIPADKPVFDFVLLTHAHTDHGQGLKPLMKYFGTRRFWYPKSIEWGGLATLLNFANRSPNVVSHQALDRTKQLPALGDVAMRILWPPRNRLDPRNENNNSVILDLRLGDVSFLLTGDAEEPVWHEIASQIPPTTRFFKMPHHGSKNGTFFENGNPAWLNECPPGALLGISSHVRPFDHPSPETVARLDHDRRPYYRTDRNYHVTFETDGTQVQVHYYR